MKKFYTLTFLYLICAIQANGQYITVWKTDNPGSSASNEIIIPATGNNYNIAWEEIGNPSNNGVATGVSGNYTIQFQTAGTYQVSITPGAGTFSKINFGPNTDHQKILEIRQWGDIAWESMEYAYASCYNLTVTATDIPDLSNVSSMQGMFSSCLRLPGIPQINNWNVSNVTDMGYLFSNTHFNDPINNWDVSNVTDMSGMFSDTPFNQPIANWIVGNVTNMSYMFHKTVTFNQPIGGWDVSKVTDMSYMFAESESFNQPIDDWETGAVVNMRSMFGLSVVFNQPIGSWDVSNVTDMELMFWNTGFNQPIGDWNTGNVTTMARMFYQATAFNQPIGDWDVGNVLDMQYTFYGAGVFNQPIGTWDMGNVITTQAMFYGASAFNQPLNDWDMSHVADLSFMFYGAVSFNQPVNEWDLSSATTLTAMFFQAVSFNQPVNDWDVSNATYLQGVFIFASAFNQPLDKWTLSSATDMTSLLDGTAMDCGNMSLTLRGWAENPATPNNIVFGAAGIKYGLPAAAHLETLRTTKNWTITIGEGVECAALEVSLISFNAKMSNGTVKLDWATATETNNDYFEIQRSADARNWNAIGRNEGAGTVNSVRHYSFIDSNPVDGVSYYRLKIVDLAGKADYSNVRAVDLKTVRVLGIYPNPASDILLIENYQQVKHIEMFNAAGKKLLENRKVTAQGIDISKFLPGLHTVKMILTDGTFHTTKLAIFR